MILIKVDNLAKNLTDMEINKGHPNQNKKRIFILNLLQQGRQPPSFGFDKWSKADCRVGRLYGEKREGTGVLLLETGGLVWL
jgi:hypothetical protein